MPLSCALLRNAQSCAALPDQTRHDRLTAGHQRPRRKDPVHSSSAPRLIRRVVQPPVVSDSGSRDSVVDDQLQLEQDVPQGGFHNAASTQPASILELPDSPTRTMPSAFAPAAPHTRLLAPPEIMTGRTHEAVQLRFPRHCPSAPEVFPTVLNRRRPPHHEPLTRIRDERRLRLILVEGPHPGRKPMPHLIGKVLASALTQLDRAQHEITPPTEPVRPQGRPGRSPHAARSH